MGAFELAQLGGAWPVAVSLATVVTVRGFTAGRRRTSLNESLHELRRPLHALALSLHAESSRTGPGVDSALRMAVSALDRLDREINGGAGAARQAPVAVRPLLASVAERWRARAEADGGALELRCVGQEARVAGDRAELERAIDNLVANAIEHGGPRVSIVATRAAGVLRLGVTDSGRLARPRVSRGGARERLAVRLSGRRRHGHGLRLVRRIAAAHGGEFELRVGSEGTAAILELPLVGVDG